MRHSAAWAGIVGLLGVSGAAAAQERLFALTDYLFPQIVELDPVTGSVQSSVTVTGHEALFGGLAVDAAGDLYSIDGYNDANPDRLFRIDAPTGTGTVVGPTGFNWNFRTVCVNPVNDILYGARDNGLYTLNRTTGAATLVANVTAATSAGLDQLTALAINAQGQAFITDIGNTTLLSLNLQTGAATKIADIGQSGNWFDDLAFNAAGVLHGVRLSGGVSTIDTSTGAETPLFFGAYKGLAFVSDSCYPDCNDDSALTVADFGCFQTKFVAGDPYADCNGDGARTVADFGCFQTRFVQGCP